MLSARSQFTGRKPASPQVTTPRPRPDMACMRDTRRRGSSPAPQVNRSCGSPAPEANPFPPGARQECVRKRAFYLPPAAVRVAGRRKHGIRHRRRLVAASHSQSHCAVMFVAARAQQTRRKRVLAQLRIAHCTAGVAWCRAATNARRRRTRGHMGGIIREKRR